MLLFYAFFPSILNDVLLFISAMQFLDCECLMVLDASTELSVWMTYI